jgi:hypothetical protein
LPVLSIGGMNMDQVRNLLDRPRLYYNIDGLRELGGGVMSMACALVLWLLAHSPARSVWHQIFWLVLLGLMLVVHYGTKAIKTHITYPRTGFVEYRRSDRRRTSIISAVFGALLPLGLFVADRRQWDVTAAAFLAGLVFAAVYAYRFAGAARWKWVVVGAIVLGDLVITFAPADVLAALANDSLVAHPFRTKLVGVILLSLATYGPMLLISGSISFWFYLRHTQTPMQEGG